MAGGRGEMRQLMRGVFREQAKEPVLLLNLLRQHWSGVVGPELGAKTHPQRLDGGTLWVAATDACWAYELQFFKPELLASVQAFLESRAVSDLRFQAGVVPSPAVSAPASPAAGNAPIHDPPAAEPMRAESSPVRSPSRPPASYQPTAPAPRAPARVTTAEAPAEAPPALARAAASIGDPALRALFQRSLAKQRLGRERQPGTVRPPPDAEKP
ncbi:MAG TPA: DUF721 domain-containing protein [bacterium]|nr:DUF721 domain-containing protein [bacterium]